MTAGLKKGSIYYEENRKRFTYSVRIDGQRYVLHDRDEALLIVKANELIERIESIPNIVQKRNVLLKDYAKLWLDEVKPTLKPKTYHGYERTVYNYIIPYLGDKKLFDLVRSDVQDFLNSIAASNGFHGKKLSRNTLKNIRNILRVCLNYALADKYITVNPVITTKIPDARRKKEIIVLAPDELKHLLDVARKGEYLYDTCLSKLQRNPARDYLEKMYYHSINLDANSALRYGENFGLTWDDIDWDTATITVRNNIINVGGKIVCGTPKNNQIRHIKLKQKAIEALKEWKVYYDDYVASCGDGFKNELNLVFPNSSGGFEQESNFRKKCWLKLIKATCVNKGFTFHCLRHTHLTLLLAAGVPAADVADRAGHSDPEVTLRIYDHVLKKFNDKCVTALENMDF